MIACVATRVRLALGSVAILLSGGLPLFAQGDGPATLAWKEGEAKRWHVELKGLSKAHLNYFSKPREAAPDWAATLAVRVDQEALKAALHTPPMSGTYRLEGGSLCFYPRFPLAAGLAYRAVYRDPLDREANAMVSVKRMAAVEKAPSTRVVEIYPTAPALPENLLKFYVHFSAPMSRGGIYEHIELLDQAGRKVEIPFLEIDEELWDPTMQRVTLFIDPGRIKRGVKPLVEVGPALQPEEAYRLRIAANWTDGDGLPLVEAFEKSFTVRPADRKAPVASAWTFESLPSAGTREALLVRFEESMDHALAQRLIRVLDGSGRILDGEVTLAEAETEWRFRPSTPWRAGEHRLRAGTLLEDLAGNQLGKVFEVDVFEEIDDENELTKERWVDRPFSIPGS